MNRALATSTLLLVTLLGVTACASDAPEAAFPEEPTTAEIQEQTESDAEESTGTESSEFVMPHGARPASADFPFPVPEDWFELTPFTEEKIGKDMAMSASFGFPGDADSASATYQKLLEEAGFQVHPNPLGEQVHAASFITKGKVDEVAYAGTLDFDTDAEGTPRVVINLAED